VSSFTSAAFYDNLEMMKSMSIFLRVLSLITLLAVLIAPVSTVAAEYAMANVSSRASVDMDKMAGNMPCCPDEKLAKPACDNSCPFIIICSTSAPVALLRAGWTSASLAWTDQVFSEQCFARLSSLATEPPARPPKA
jgi:hypothetical protein